MISRIRACRSDASTWQVGFLAYYVSVLLPSLYDQALTEMREEVVGKDAQDALEPTLFFAYVFQQCACAIAIASQLLVSSGAAYAVRRIFGRGLKAEPRGGQRRAPVELERAIAPWQCAALEKVLKGQRVRVRTTRADASYAEKEHIPHVHVYLQVSAGASDPTRRDTRGLLLLLLCPSELTRHVHRSTWSLEPSGGRTIRTSASTRCGDLRAISWRDLSGAISGAISGASRMHRARRWSR